MKWNIVMLVLMVIKLIPLCACLCVLLYRTWRKRAVRVRAGCNRRVEVGGDGAESCTADFGPS